MEKPGYMSNEQWEILVSSGLDKILEKSTYKHPVIPAELRVSLMGWNYLLERWEQQVIYLFKKEFFRRGIEYVSLRGYIDTRVDANIRLRRYEEFVYDRIAFPPTSEHERIEGDRRLKEYIDRLNRLVEISGIEVETDDSVLMRDSLRYPAASEDAIQSVESRLGLRFPPSYREFLGISNGWLIKESPSIWAVEKVGFLREIAPEYIKIWLEHEFLHDSGEYILTQEPKGEGQPFDSRALDVPTRCLKQAVVIGVDEQESSYLILDPTTMDERGEWRVMMLFRYEYSIVARDFARLMEILYRMDARRPAD